jgi:iron(III) transport system ATP-binding protein
LSSVTIEGLNKVYYGGVRAVDDMSLTVKRGEMLVLVGPSGCGKTTCLRCIAGLERPSGGTITIGDQVVTSIERGIFVPPERREIGMVFQSYAIWPHMTVFENVAYPLRAIGVAKADIRTQVESVLKLTQLETLTNRYSSQISGGQQQRVALARSLVAKPKLLLFDEPLSNLDANLRIQMRQEIKELQQRLGFTAFYVTHDQAEAMAVADRIAVVEGGRIRQIGSPQEVYERPVSAFVAAFMGGANLFSGVVGGHHSEGMVVEIDGGLSALVPQNSVPVGRAVQISIRPEAFRLRAGISQGNEEWPGRVVGMTYVGNMIIYRVQVGAHLVEVHTPPTERFSLGTEVCLAAAVKHRIVIDDEDRG